MWKKESMYFPRVPKKILSLIGPTYIWPQINYYSQDDILFVICSPSKNHTAYEWWRGDSLRDSWGVFFQEETQMLESQAQEMAIVFYFHISFWQEEFPNYCIT